MAAAKKRAAARRSRKTRPPKKKAGRKNQAGGRKCRAFGETKSIYEWSQDRRCKVVYITIRRRLEQGWTAEKAITTRGMQRCRAFGCTKTLQEWANDERCSVSHAVLAARLRLGWPAKVSITYPIGKTYRRRGAVGRKFGAFGERQAISEWAADARCRVSHNTLRIRMGNGWDSELAVSTPAGGFRHPRTRPAASRRLKK